MNFMKYISTLCFFLCAVLYSTETNGQFLQCETVGPSIKIADAQPCTNEEFCLDVTVLDFTDITSAKFPISWDTSIVEFIGVQNLNLTALVVEDFDETEVDNGLLKVDWVYKECDVADDAITIPDNQVIFRLCFRAKASYGETTVIDIPNDSELTNDPEPISVKRLNVCISNIGLCATPSFISTCVSPLELYCTSTIGNPGELVSVDVKSRGFRSLNSLQFSMNWDTSVVQFENVIPLENLVNLNISQFGTPDQANIGPGNLTVSWSFIDANAPGVDLGDDLTIFTLNFRIIGECETSSAINFSASPTLIEGINTRIEDGSEILSPVPIRLTEGEVSVGDCIPGGLLVSANCGAPVNINEEVCVVVTAAQLADISDIRYLMEWNPNILQFKRIQSLNSVAIPSLSISDFNTDNVVNGVLELDWDSSGPFFNANIPDGATLYEVCFDVIGLGGNSPFRFDPRNAFVRQEGSFRDIGISPTNCEVEVIQPDGVTISISESQAPPGDVVCLDVTAANFQDLIDLQFSLSWEPNHASFVGVDNVNPAIAADATFGTAGASSGSFTFEWDNNTPLNLDPDEVLFSLCLEVVGTPPGELSQERNCQAVSIESFPLEGQAISSTSNNNNIGLTGVDGEVCVLNPEGFFLVIENDESFRGTSECIDFKVAEFDSITSAQFTINWDPTLLRFNGILNLNAIPDLAIGTNIDTSSASVGIIGFDWNELLSLTLPDSASLLEVCYELIGPADECAQIEINADPNPSVTTINGAGSVFPIGGGICIKDTLIIVDSLITPVTCPDGRDGTIELTVQGGNGQIFYNWRALNSTQFLPKAVNLPVGTVEVTVFDNSIPALVTRDTFFIPLTDVLPEANAGEDRTIDCETGLVLLNGTGSEGDIYSYRWQTTNGGTIGGNPSNESIVARSPGTYILAVFNSETNCAARDTMQVIRPDLPVADAGRDVFFTCADSVQVLDASASTALDTNLTYIWTAFSGGLIEPGDEVDVVNPTIRAEGVYALEVRDKNTGCFTTDTVEAISVTSFTPVFAGNDRELTCDTVGITLIADIDNAVRDFTIEWFDEAGTSLVVDDRVQVNMPGNYIVMATDVDNLCSTMDTVQVLPNSALPVITLADSAAIDCNNPTVSLLAEVSNTDSFTLQWQALNGGLLEENPDNPLNPTITAAGTFTLMVMDTTTSCSTIDSVVVSNNIEVLAVDAGLGGELTCEIPNITLRGIVDTGFTLSWTLEDQELGTTDTLNVGAPGTYYLTVLNPVTGCSNRDSVIVTSSADLPEIEIAEIPVITCDISEVMVNATVTPADVTYNLSWTALDGGIISGVTDQLQVTISAAGTYQLEATNPITGCVTTREVIIPTDTVPPLAVAGDDQILTCADDAVTLNGLGSAEGATIVYNWSAMDGGMTPSPANALQTTATAPGTYILEVRDTLTGCIATDMVLVMPDTALPNIQLATPATLTCMMNMITLDATGSDSGSGFSVAWNPLDGQAAPQVGQDPLQASITAAGNYELVITNSNTGCASTETFVVEENRVLPMADAGQDIIVTCPGNTFVLDGSASEQGASIRYLWTSSDGVEISNDTTLAPTITQPGIFELVVTNSANGCSNTATVNATLDPNLVEANAGTDDTACGLDAVLFASDASGASGRWTTSGAANIDMPDGASTTIGNLQPGNNIFVWTLSTADCPNYSQDSVTVIREEAPIASADAVTLDVGSLELNINVTANDIISSQTGATVTVLNAPTLGAIAPTSSGENLTYRVAGGVFGDDSFTYEVCNTTCQTLCDTATVSVQIPFDPNYTATLANGITPNGDGQNDFLTFEAIERDPDAFPDNELIIFNRWGDIVFQARPYTNNWEGTNASGLDLPQGTYYYILRLDISEGNILKGDVTIIK